MFQNCSFCIFTQNGRSGDVAKYFKLKIYQIIHFFIKLKGMGGGNEQGEEELVFVHFL